MTSPALTEEQRAGTDERSWNVALLMPEEPGRRNRRTIDGIAAAAAAIVCGLAAVAAYAATDVDTEVGDAVVTVLGWAPTVWHTAFVAALALAAVVVAAVVARRRWQLARDLVVALVLANVAGAVLARIVESGWVAFEASLFSRWGFPELRLALVVAVLTVAGPVLTRTARAVAMSLVGLAAVGAVALDIAPPSQALGGLALGLASGALVRLAFGSPAGVPPTQRVRAALTALGVDARDLVIAKQQRRGSAVYYGHDADGGPLKVRVLSRDAQDTQRLARRWRLLSYRDPVRGAPVGRLEQAEHEALATLLAAQAGVRVPTVVTAGLGADGDAIVVTRQADVTPLELESADQVSDAVLGDLWRQIALLHTAGIAHGRLNASNVVVDRDGPMLVDFSEAMLGASRAALDMDAAEMLVACCVLVGPERTLSRAVAAGWSDAVANVLPYLQRAALTPHLRDLAREHEVGIAQLRRDAAAATGTKEPEIAPLRRVRPKDVLLTALLILSAYLLITQLAEIGFSRIVDELSRAEPVWLVVGLLLAQVALIGSGISVRGAVTTPLALLPCVVLQSAIKFINLTVPSSAGRIGMNVRFLQKQGVSGAQALAAGAVDDVSESMVQAGLLLAVLPFVGAKIDTGQFHGTGPDTRLLIGIAAALVVVALVVWRVPSVHDRVVPGVRSALSGVWAVARVRRKRIELFGGNVISELTYSLALGATCLAYGVDLNLAQLVFVNTFAAVLSGLIPVPGGIGAAEAALSAGLISMGVDESTAFAIAITQRFWTFYLPPIWGYVGLSWLGRKGYV